MTLFGLDVWALAAVGTAFVGGMFAGRAVVLWALRAQLGPVYRRIADLCEEMAGSASGTTRKELLGIAVSLRATAGGW